MPEDYDIVASRAVASPFYSAPHPEDVEPRPYQDAGVAYCLARDHALIGDAPGVGKTAQGIMVSNAIEAEHTLVLCPASLRFNWEREVRTWSTLPRVSTYPITKSKDGVSLEANYVIVSYDLLRNPAIFAAIMDARWDHLICDEAHALKDPRGNRRTQLICAPDALPSVVGRISLLSGTILPNQPSEVYNCCRLLNWSALDNCSYEAFRQFYYAEGGGFVRSPVTKTSAAGQTYTVSELHYSDKVRNIPRNLDDLQYRLRKHIMVRRLKEDVLPQLPKKQWHMFPMAVDADMRRALKHPGWQTVERLYEQDPGAFTAGAPIDGAIATARRELGEAKAPAVADYIDDLMDSGVRKLVVGCWHTSVLAYLADRLGRHGLVVMGAMGKRQAMADKFQLEDSVKIILGQMSVLGLGWTLTAAQDAVLAEFDWVPAVNDQFLDRIHRLGQKGSHVIGHVPVIAGSMEEHIIGSVISKDINIYNALDRRAA